MKKTIISLYPAVVLMTTFLLPLALQSQTPSGAASEDEMLQKAQQGITAERLAEHVKILASDRFEGRFPASRGEELTAAYLEQQFKLLGLKPPVNGSYFQEVPLAEISYDDSAEFTVTSETADRRFRFGADFVALSPRLTGKTVVDRVPVVFAGYGISAPEFEWNDYEGLDVRGKLVLMLLNEPGYDDPTPTLFEGTALTRYGRADYKYEEAFRRGALGVFIIHQDRSAGYPWASERFSKPRPKFFFNDGNRNENQLAIQGWISYPAAHALFNGLGQSLDEWISRAGKKGFCGGEIRAKGSLTLKNRYRFVKTRNIMAIYPGNELADEAVVFIAHWDHLGKDEGLAGPDKIYNGAADNAVGVAALLELARAYRGLSQPMRRSVLFLMPTCEERGLLGSRYYVEHPVIPLAKTAAAINIDGVSLVGKMKDVTIIGYGLSELDRYVRREAEREGRYVTPDRHLDQGYFFRLDHFNFARAGVPAVHIGMGGDSELYGREWVEQKRAKDIAAHYHQVSDEYNESVWDLSGCIADLALIFRTGYRLAMAEAHPQWNEGVSYKTIRFEQPQK